MDERERLRDALFSDRFESHWCVACGDHGALFAIPPGEFLGACARCLADRIERMRTEGWDLPAWVTVLEQEAREEVAYQAKKQASEFELRFDAFYHCIRCGRLIHQRDARYPLEAKDPQGAISPHCIECYSAVTGRR